MICNITRLTRTLKFLQILNVFLNSDMFILFESRKELYREGRKENVMVLASQIKPASHSIYQWGKGCLRQKGRHIQLFCKATGEQCENDCSVKQSQIAC